MREKDERRIVIDTNIWISFLLGGVARNLVKIFNPPFPKILFSEELLEELKETLLRPKFKSRFDPEVLMKIELLLSVHGEKIQVASTVTICRDEKDNFLLSLCQDGKADFLITGDEDFLVLKKFNETEIIPLKKILAED
ncbi:MAG: putative toxin-antitoxin system toxin component, PIN family [Chitinophagales bacterium]